MTTPIRRGFNEPGQLTASRRSLQQVTPICRTPRRDKAGITGRFIELDSVTTVFVIEESAPADYTCPIAGNCRIAHTGNRFRLITHRCNDFRSSPTMWRQPWPQTQRRHSQVALREQCVLAIYAKQICPQGLEFAANAKRAAPQHLPTCNRHPEIAAAPTDHNGRSD